MARDARAKTVAGQMDLPGRSEHGVQMFKLAREGLGLRFHLLIWNPPVRIQMRPELGTPSAKRPRGLARQVNVHRYGIEVGAVSELRPVVRNHIHLWTGICRLTHCIRIWLFQGAGKIRNPRVCIRVILTRRVYTVSERLVLIGRPPQARSYATPSMHKNIGFRIGVEQTASMGPTHFRGPSKGAISLQATRRVENLQVR